MKLRNLFLSGFALCSMSLFAQTHTQGIEYFKAEQYTNALELLNRNLNNPGTDKALSYYYLGQIEMRRDNISGATKYFQDGIALDPTCPYNYIGLGYIALKQGDVKQAEKYFKDAEKNGKKDQSVQVEIARSYYNVDPVAYKAKYEKILANALKKDPQNPDIYILQGDMLRDEAYNTQDSKTYGRAAAQYDMATSYDPQSAVAYVKYADMYTNAKNPNYAIIKLEELVSNNPSSALGQRELANLYYDTEQYKKAATKYGEYVKNPNHFREDEDRYSLLLYFDDDYQEGYDYATELLASNPNNFTAQRFQFMNASNLDSMKDQLLPLADNLYANHKKDKANRFAPIDYLLLASAFGDNGRTDDAIAVLQEGIADDPKNASFERSLSGIYLNNDDYANAAKAYTNYIAKTANPTYNDFIRATIYAYNAAVKNNNDPAFFDMAVEYANKAKAADDIQYQPYKLIGDIAMTRANQAQAGSVAVNDYLEALKRIEANPDPKYNNDAATIYKYLGAYYLEKKDNASAKKYLGKYLEINPQDDKIKKAYNAL